MVFSRSFNTWTVLLAALAVSTQALQREAGQVVGDLAKRQTTCLRSGWVPICPEPLPCAPPGAICCDPNEYALPPNTCPAGTTPVGDVPVSSPAVTSAPPVVTLPPTVEFTWYTRYITYTYWWTYWTIYGGVTRYSSTVTYWSTTISFTATNEAQATSILASYSSALSASIPTQTATPTLVASSATPPPTAELPTETPTTELPTLIPNATVSSPSSPPVFTGGASLTRAGVSFFGNMVTLGLGALVVGPGVLMLLL